MAGGNDPNTAFLAHFDFNNKPHVVTANGNAQVDTGVTDPFGDSEGVALFDGSTAYLSTPDNVDFALGDTFGINGWCRAAALPTSGNEMTLLARRDSSGDNVWALRIINDSGTYKLRGSVYESGYIVDQSYAISISTLNWYHFAWMHNANAWYLYWAGAYLGTLTDSDTVGDYAGPLTIGYYSSGYPRMFNGQLSCIRINKDNCPILDPASDLYISSGDPTDGIVVPTAPPTASNGGNNTSTVLFIPCTGADESTDFEDIGLGSRLTDPTNIIDSAVGGSGNAIVCTGSAGLSAGGKFGNGELSTTGSPDRISTTLSSSPGTGDFCVDGWLEFSSFGTYNAPFEVGTYGSGNGFFFQIWSTGRVVCYVNGAGVLDSFPTMHTFSVGTKYHYAYVRKSGVLYLFIDGVLILSGANTSNITAISFSLGARNSLEDYVNGKHDEVRVSYGTARIDDSDDPLYKDGNPANGITVPTRAYLEYRTSRLDVLRNLFQNKAIALHVLRDYFSSVYSSQLDIKRNNNAIKLSKFDISRSLFSNVYSSQVDILRSLRETKASQIDAFRQFRQANAIQLDTLRNIRTIHDLQLDTLRTYRQFFRSQIDLRRHLIEQTEYRLYARNLATGVESLLGTFDSNYQLSGIAVADGKYNLIVEADGNLYSNCRPIWAVTFIVGQETPGEIDTVGLPEIMSLTSASYRNWTRISWEVTSNVDDDATGFKLWFSDTSPVDTSGDPDETVSYFPGNFEYWFDYAQTAAKYVAVAPYDSSQQGIAQELYLSWTGTPTGPEYEWIQDNG